MYEISEKFSGTYSNSVPGKKSSTGNQTFLNHKSKSSQPSRKSSNFEQVANKTEQ